MAKQKTKTINPKTPNFFITSSINEKKTRLSHYNFPQAGEVASPGPVGIKIGSSPCLVVR